MAVIRIGGEEAVVYDNRTLYPSPVCYRIKDTIDNKKKVDSNINITIVEGFAIDEIQDVPVEDNQQEVQQQTTEITNEQNKNNPSETEVN